MSIVDGGKVARLRQQRGWNQKQLAAAADIAPAVVTRLERDLQADFKISVVAALASALEVTIDALLIRATKSKTEESVDELRSIVTEVEQQPPTVQRQAAAILRAFLDYQP